MKENIVIIGGGIAGMEAARQLVRLGYDPIIIERDERLGGHVAQWHCLFPDITPASEVVSEIAGEISGAAHVFLRTEILSINRLKDSYNMMLSNGISIITRIILFATGFRVFEAERKEEYGYGVYNQVMTNRDLERWFNTGDDPRVDDRAMRAVGFVHCVGSRDEKAGNTQCSKVCCITAIKQAIEMKQRFPFVTVYCFYMDLRLFGKKYEDFYISAQRDYGIRFIRGRVSEVSETIDGKVVVKAEDTLSGRPVKVTLDLLVLMAGMVCNPEGSRVASMVDLRQDSDGFLKSRDNIASITETARPGIFLCGACTGPKTVPETLAEARSVALSIHSYIQTLH